jgi:DNA-binding NarL/FixJ family response regulator
MEDPIKVIVADDHELLRDGLVKLLDKYEDIQVVAQASNGKQLVQLSEQLLPDVVLADIQMPLMDGVEATSIITKKWAATRVIAYSMMDNSYRIADMLAAGAKGYLLKGAAKEEIVEGIRAVNADKDYYCNGSTEIMQTALASNRLPPGIAFKKLRFTKREKQIIPLICEGLSAQEISERIFLSPKTIENYKAALLQKTGCKNTANFVYFIMQNNLYKP